MALVCVLAELQSPNRNKQSSSSKSKYLPQPVTARSRSLQRDYAGREQKTDMPPELSQFCSWTMHTFPRLLSNVCGLPGSVLAAGAMAANRTEPTPALTGLTHHYSP